MKDHMIKDNSAEELPAFLKQTFPELHLDRPIHLQLSSIDMVHLVSAIEKHFNIEIDHKDIKKGFLKDFETTLSVLKEKRSKPST